MADMDEILRSNARVGSVCDWTLAGVGAASILAMAGAPLIWLSAGNAWLAVAAPSAVIVTAVILAVLVQRGAVRRHAALCDAYTASTGA